MTLPIEEFLMLGTAEGAFGGVEPGEPLSAALVEALSCCADHIGHLNGCRGIYFAPPPVSPLLASGRESSGLAVASRCCCERWR